SPSTDRFNDRRPDPGKALETSGLVLPSVRFTDLRSDTQPAGQVRSIKRSVDLRVVVKVAIDVSRGDRWLAVRDHNPGIVHLPSMPPRFDASRPVVESPGAVAARIQFFVAVQPDVDKASGHVFQKRPAPGRVGDDKGDPVLA